MRLRNSLIFISLTIACSFLFSSCAFLIGETVAPNNCKKCQIVSSNGDVLFEEDGCGGNLYNMKQRLKAKAFDAGCCSCRLDCETYKKEDGNVKSAE